MDGRTARRQKREHPFAALRSRREKKGRLPIYECRPRRPWWISKKGGQEECDNLSLALARSGFLDYGLCILDFGLTSPIYGWRPVSRRRPTGAACHTLRRRQKSITSIFLGSNSTKVDTRQLFTAESVSWWGPSVVPQLVGLFSPRLSHERRGGVGVNRMMM